MPGTLPEEGVQATSLFKHPKIRLSRSPPLSAARSYLNRFLMIPPAGGEPTGGWPHVSCSGLAWPGRARSNPATRRSPMSPDPRRGTPAPTYRACLVLVVLMKASDPLFV
ncbi:hypothetical protein CHARACLAT_008229 [Characodon lateralis]|uniref:Uncharacterized protein n=1 Tax=Characodon lateralis TaxID=208331 RepID=A0ABU7ET13_9TELE|nr:hypothetical protein [Characodon lateralis]